MECHYLQTPNQQEITISFDTLRRDKLFCTAVNNRLQYLRAYHEQFGQFAGLLESGPGQAKT